MVTGDYHHTAIAVGRLVGMIPGGSPIVILQAKSELGRQSPQSSSTAQTAILNSNLPRPGIQTITAGHDSSESGDHLVSILDIGVNSEDVTFTEALTAIAQVISHLLQLDSDLSCRGIQMMNDSSEVGDLLASVQDTGVNSEEMTFTENFDNFCSGKHPFFAAQTALLDSELPRGGIQMVTVGHDSLNQATNLCPS